VPWMAPCSLPLLDLRSLSPQNAGSSLEEALGIRPSEAALLSKSYSPRHVYALQHLPHRQLKAAVGDILGPDAWDAYAKVLGLSAASLLSFNPCSALQHL